MKTVKELLRAWFILIAIFLPIWLLTRLTHDDTTFTEAEIDHAEAVEVDASIVPLAGISQDVPRNVLTEADILAIVQREADEIQVALAEYEAAGSEAKTAELRAAWQLLNGYLAS